MAMEIEIVGDVVEIETIAIGHGIREIALLLRNTQVLRVS
jgi:hypothetical protein